MWIAILGAGGIGGYYGGTFTYRRLVIERGWSSDQYEKWLADTLVTALIAPARK